MEIAKRFGNRETEAVLDRFELDSGAVASFLEASRPRFLKIPARTRSTSFFIPPAQKREREGSKGEKGV